LGNRTSAADACFVIPGDVHSHRAIRRPGDNAVYIGNTSEWYEIKTPSRDVLQAMQSLLGAKAT